MTGNRFRILYEDPSSSARIGLYETDHGPVETPCFAPVGTYGAVKAVPHATLEAMGFRLILANTYHLYLRPGPETIRALGGLHRFVAWPHALLTDSGGYQVFSLARLRKITDEGITFQSHLDGTTHELTPERTVEIQEALGSDIAMALDECPPYGCERSDLEQAVRRTVAWARRCKAVHRRPDQSLWGITQGGTDPQLRRVCTEQILEIGFDGYAIGGLAVGEPRAEMYDAIADAAARLPRDHIRYLMGVGLPQDVVYAVLQGVDLMDCVVPTRHARNGYLFTREGPLHIKNSRYRADPDPPDPTRDCPLCRQYSRAYLRHLFMAREVLFTVLNTVHNLYFYRRLLDEVRTAVRQGSLPALYRFYEDRYGPGARPPEA